MNNLQKNNQQFEQVTLDSSNESDNMVLVEFQELIKQVTKEIMEYSVFNEIKELEKEMREKLQELNSDIIKIKVLTQSIENVNNKFIKNLDGLSEERDENNNKYNKIITMLNNVNQEFVEKNAKIFKLNKSYLENTNIILQNNTNKILSGIETCNCKNDNLIGSNKKLIILTWFNIIMLTTTMGMLLYMLRG